MRRFTTPLGLAAFAALLVAARCHAQMPLWQDFYYHGDMLAQPPVAFQSTDRQQPDTTNIVIGTNYAGTIQVGTNFYTVRDLEGPLTFTDTVYVDCVLTNAGTNEMWQQPQYLTNWIYTATNCTIQCSHK